MRSIPFKLLALLILLPLQTALAAGKPNILIIWGDDIGQFNVSAYNMGMMGYKTPNIDRIAKEGAVFTDWYGQQSCTCLLTGTASKVARPVAPLSSPASHRCVPV